MPIGKLEIQLLPVVLFVVIPELKLLFVSSMAISVLAHSWLPSPTFKVNDVQFQPLAVACVGLFPRLWRCLSCFIVLFCYFSIICIYSTNRWNQSMYLLTYLYTNLCKHLNGISIIYSKCPAEKCANSSTSNL